MSLIARDNTVYRTEEEFEAPVKKKRDKDIKKTRDDMFGEDIRLPPVRTRYDENDKGVDW